MFRKHHSLPKEHQFVSMQSVSDRDISSVSDDADRDRLGHHLIIDLCGCNPEKLKVVPVVEEILRAAAAAARATIVASKFHQFAPIGVSGALVLAESHITIHTWPEADGYCAIDIFTCGPTDNFLALDVMKNGFESKDCVLVEIERGAQKPAEDAATAVEPRNARWISEELDPLGGFKPTMKVTELLEEVQSPFQNVKMFNTTGVGKMMVIDGIIQLTEYDHFAYHEMITHVPMQVHPNPTKVLIIGGGDGGALLEVEKYAGVTEIVICDIDEAVMKVACNHLPEFAAAYKDPRVRAVFQDGAALVANFQNYFDVIIVDCTDFYGVAAPLARKSFYESIRNALTADGLMVIQAESMYYDRNWISQLHKQCQELFPITQYYHTHVPTYPSGCIGFVYCSKKYNYWENIGGAGVGMAALAAGPAAAIALPPSPPVDADGATANKVEGTGAVPPPTRDGYDHQQLMAGMEYYTPALHLAAFQLPAFLNKLIA